MTWTAASHLRGGQEELAEPWDEGPETGFGGQASAGASYSDGAQVSVILA